jgi:hypothetical protein
LKALDLVDNHLNDSDFVLIANALRSNTTLRSLKLGDITNDVLEAFRLVLCDKSSLNAVADSNHSCILQALRYFTWNNYHSHYGDNRGWKIYSILKSRNETMSNVQHFDDIDVKLLPNMLENVQKYSKTVFQWGKDEEALSIVYEVMRKWDKVFPLFKSSVVGNNDT